MNYSQCPIYASLRVKPKAGTITLEYLELNGEPIILFYDDGRGLDLKKIRAIAEAKNFISSTDAFSAQAVAELIFMQEFSTKTEVSLVSGRGVGMGALKFLLRGAGGDIHLELGDTEDKEGLRSFRLRLVLAKNMVVGRVSPALRLAV